MRLTADEEPYGLGVAYSATQFPVTGNLCKRAGDAPLRQWTTSGRIEME